MRERERVECVGDREQAEQERATEVGPDHRLSLSGASIGPGACVEREEQVGRQLGGDEVAHLRRVRVEDEDRHKRERDQADLIPEQRCGLTEPEAPEARVLAQEGRHHHGGAL